MTQTLSTQAQCLCGAITVKAGALNPHLHACHCSMCRQWGSAPYFALDAQQSVTIEGEDKLSVYPSSDWAERGFCSVCGTHLFYRFRKTQQTMLSAGLFHHLDDKLHFGTQFFIDNKPDFYAFANQTEDLTEAEIFAAFSDV